MIYVLNLYIIVYFFGSSKLYSHAPPIMRLHFYDCFSLKYVHALRKLGFETRFNFYTILNGVIK